MKTGNEIIASYLGWEKANAGHLVPNNWPFDGDTGYTEIRPDQMIFDTIQWLYPVYLKLRKELKDINISSYSTSDGDYIRRAAYNRRSAIEVALIQGDIAELHSEIVKGIQFITENKKVK